jgi:hypothetical protein
MRDVEPAAAERERFLDHAVDVGFDGDITLRHATVLLTFPGAAR